MVNAIDEKILSLDFNQLCIAIEEMDPKRELRTYKLLKTIYDNAYINKVKEQTQEIKSKKRNIYFKELFYCLYKKNSYEKCLFTMISLSIKYNYGIFENNSYAIESSLFPRNISRFLNEIDVSKTNYISYDLIEQLHIFFNNELMKNKFVIYIPLIGWINTRYFKKYIKMNQSDFDSSIISYLNSREKSVLSKIDKNIPLLKFDISPTKRFKSFYKDSLDAFSAYQSAKHGMPRKYTNYYSISGHEYPIE